MPLNIAYISYEFPPDTSGGGIGSYTEQVATIVAAKGNSVCVFCGTTKSDYRYEQNGVTIYRVKAAGTDEFRNKVVDTFNLVHQQQPFDLIESPDYGADGYKVKLANPALPYIIKLHTPSYIIKEYNNYYKQYVLPYQFLTVLKSKLLGRKERQDTENDIEFLNVQLANCILSPSLDLAKRIAKDWNIPLNHINIIPNPYHPDVVQLNIPLQYNNNRVTFIGKFSVLKGAVDFIKIIPMVLNKIPGLRFRFIGDDSFSPKPGKTMKEYVLGRCAAYKNNIELTGKVPLTDISKYLGETDIVLCNSLWENYPTVILEAMSAGRVVIASKTGGIPEIITHNKNGLLVGIRSGKQIAAQILSCYQNKQQMKILGENARAFITNFSSNDQLIDKIIENYKKVVTVHE